MEPKIDCWRLATFLNCAVPENIHTPPTEGFLFCTSPSPPGNSSLFSYMGWVWIISETTHFALSNTGDVVTNIVPTSSQFGLDCRMPHNSSCTTQSLKMAMPLEQAVGMKVSASTGKEWFSGRYASMHSPRCFMDFFRVFQWNLAVILSIFA